MGCDAEVGPSKGQASDLGGGWHWGGWSPRHSHNLGSSVGLRVNTVLKIEYRMTFFVLFFVSSVLLSGRI